MSERLEGWCPTCKDYMCPGWTGRGYRCPKCDALLKYISVVAVSERTGQSYGPHRLIPIGRGEG